MDERDPPGYDDWFDEPEPPTLESGRGGRQPYDAPSEREEDVWTVPEDESRRRRRSQGSGNVVIGGHSFTTTQIAIIAIAALAVFIAILAAAGVFSHHTPTQTITSNSTPTTLQTTATTPTTPTVTAPTQTLNPGDQGFQVVRLQRALIALGYLHPPADGDFGGVTKTAVMSFQTNNGLNSDGIVGPETLAKLVEQLKTLGG
jgi:hypothetical protein